MTAAREESWLEWKIVQFLLEALRYAPDIVCMKIDSRCSYS